jgi:AraC family transcriptional regulator of adaptative response / DNA-3-methyladenine glycosylase II
MGMELDRQVCSRARLSRDARFDGKFFIGVLTTGIYCRPICPAPTAQERNVRYYASAAAAAAAGFRPCLRCRPECSPGTPAWLGTRNTVSRALRLISESGLEDGGVEALAGHLGVGPRHLRRLFLQHLGATPRAVAETRRLHFAKKLIDETSLPFGELALAAGFGCVRRFNACIRKVYDRTPSELRRLARHTKLQVSHQYLFRIRYRPPYHWDGMLAYLAARGTPGVESVADGVYRRSIAVNGVAGHFEVSQDKAGDALVARVQFEEPRALFHITERIRSIFDLNADCAAIANGLSSDPMLARMVVAQPGRRVPGCWSGFELAVRAILGQQITVKGATTVAGNIARAFGIPCAVSGSLTHLFPTAEALADADLSRVGLTKARAHTVKALARGVCQGQIQFERIVDPDDFLQRLRLIPGIGKWTSDYIAMRAFADPDAFPSSDLALLRAVGLATSRQCEQLATRWRPWRAYAAIYIWADGDRNPYKRAHRVAIKRRIGTTPDNMPRGSALEVNQ